MNKIQRPAMSKVWESATSIKLSGIWNDMADAHLNSSPENRDWSGFIKNISNRRFQRAIINHESSDDKLKKFVDVMGKHFSSKQKGLRIEGSEGKEYFIKQHKYFGGPEYTCSCPDFMYVRSVKDEECKHIKQIKEKNKTIGFTKTAEPYLARDKVEDTVDKQYTLANGKPIYHNYQTTRSDCSSASLRMVLSAYKELVSEKELSELIGVKEGVGAECDQITIAARKLGYLAIDRSIDIGELDSLLKASIPVILDVQSFTRPPPVEHYVCIYKLDEKGYHVLDPNYEERERIMSKEELLSRWHGRAMKDESEMKTWAVVILPKN